MVNGKNHEKDNQKTNMPCNISLPSINHSELPPPSITTAKYKANAETAATLLANNCSISETAAKVGISRSTIYEWMNTAHFQAMYESKKADRRLAIEAKILEAAEKKNWTAGAWLLERSPVFRGDYDPPVNRNKVEIDLNARIFTHFSSEDIIYILKNTKD